MTIHLTIAVLVTVFMAVVAVGFLYLLHARIARRAIIAVARAFVQLGIIGGCVYGLLRADSLLLNLLWLLLTVGIAAWFTTLRARLRRQSMLPVVWVSMLISVVACLLPLYCLGPVHRASLFVPLSGGLLAVAVSILPRALKEYFVALVRFSDTYYYLLGNGSSWWKAIVPMVRRAVDRSFLPSCRQLSLAGIVGLPLFVVGLLLAGLPVWSAVVVGLLLELTGIVVAILTLMLVVVFSRRLVADKRGHLSGIVRL